MKRWISYIEKVYPQTAVLDGRKFFEAVRMEDKSALKVLDKFSEYLSEGLLNLINILQPDVICIGGGISRAGDLFMPMVRKIVSEKVYSRDSEENTLLVTAQLGNDAGIIGAAMLHLCEEETEGRKQIWKSIIRK